MWVMGEVMTERLSLKYLAEIASKSVACLVLTVLINLCKVLSLTVEKTKEYERPGGHMRVLT